jgi:Fur family ferric uptake transcriptional regulator
MIIVRTIAGIVQAVAHPTPDLAGQMTAAGVRPTAQRVRVLEELAREHNDATAQELHRRLASGGDRIGLATVYRALAALSDAGLVDTLTHGQAETCYRLCATGHHHHHLVCTGCHRVVELTNCSVGEWVAKAARAEGFEATGHSLEVTGLCANCRSVQSAPAVAAGAHGSHASPSISSTELPAGSRT